MDPQTRSPLENLRRAVLRQSAERDRELDQVAAAFGDHRTSGALLERLNALNGGEGGRTAGTPA